MIHSTHLTNFKRHRSARFDFGQGLTSIQGANASGKTTALKAVVAGLFGMPAAGSKEYIPTRGETDARVEVDVTLPVHGRVTIERTLKSAKVHTTEGRLLANGVTPVTKLIEEAYGMPVADLLLLSYSRQGESQALLALGATALQKTVERLSKSDVLDRVLTQLGADIASLDAHLNALPPAGDIEALRGQSDAARDDEARLNVELASARDRVIALTQAEEAYRQRHQAAVSAQLARAQLSAQVEAQKQQALLAGQDTERLRQELKDTDPQLSVKLAEAQSQFDAAQLDLHRLQAAASEAKALLREQTHWEAQAVELREQVRQSVAVANDMEAAERDLQRLQEEKARLAAELATSQRQEQDAREAVDAGVCQRCQRPFDPEHLAEAITRHEAAKAASEAASAAWYAILPLLSDAEATLHKLKQAFHPGSAARLGSVSEQLARIQARLEEVLAGHADAGELEATYQHKATATETLRKLHADLLQQHSRQGHLLSALAASEDALTQALQRQEQLVAQLAALPEGEDPVQLSGNLSTLGQQLTEARNHEGATGQALADAGFRLRTARKALEDALSVEARRQETAESLGLHKRLQTWLRKSRADLMSELWQGLLSYASYLVNLTTEGILTRVFRLDSELVVEEAGEVVPVSELSGAQRSVVGACIRIAMSRVFYGGDLFLLLDEASESMDDDMAARFTGMLRALETQVVLVTHRTGDAVNADTTIQL